jgi:transcriptional antiterminator RfaH
VVEAIRQHVERVSAAGGEQLFGLRPGDEVLVQNGPFAGYEAIFDTRLSGSDRVRVLLKMLNDRYAPVVLPAGQIKRKR